MKPHSSFGFFNTTSRTAAQAADPDHIKGILDNVHRYQVGIKRNQWAEDEIRKIKRLNY